MGYVWESRSLPENINRARGDPAMDPLSCYSCISIGINSISSIAVCIVVSMKFKAEILIVARKNLFIKEPTALKEKPYEKKFLL